MSFFESKLKTDMTNDRRDNQSFIRRCDTVL